MAVKSKTDLIPVTRAFLWETENLIGHMLHDMRHRDMAHKARIEAQMEAVKRYLR